MVKLMSVDDYELDRETELLSIVDDFGGSIQSVQEIAMPGGMMCHEALHMSSYLERQVLHELAEHPSILSNPKWYIAARQIGELLHNLYQDIANEHMQELGIPQP